MINIELATDAQRTMIIGKRRTNAWLQKLPKNMTDEEIVRLVCKENFVEWTTLTKRSASLIIDSLVKQPGRAARSLAMKNKGQRSF